ncbi:MAG TPA: hypothetical protein PLV92_24955 [Pirellulaceae bacterium]|nr:hypothetical protein [Pirellulaceae bacterium]
MDIQAERIRASCELLGLDRVTEIYPVIAEAAIKADVVIPKFTRTKKAAEDKQTLLRNAADLRKTLDSLYLRPVESTEPELVVRRRAAGAGGELVFAINDRREAGTYVGQHGLVQEVGLPSSGEIVYRPRQAESVAAPKDAATGGSASTNKAAAATANGPSADLSTWRVYDLMARREVSVEVRDGALRWPAVVGPCDGAVWLVTARPLAALHAASPEEARLGDSITCRFAATDDRRKPLDSVIPLRVDITDPHGRPAEFSGYHAAVNGRLDLKLDFAANDTPGVWTVRAQELATGQTAVKFIRVRNADLAK